MPMLRAGLVAVILICGSVRSGLAGETCGDETAQLSADARGLIPLRQAAKRAYFDLRDKKSEDCEQFTAAIETWQQAADAHLSAYEQHSERCAPFDEMAVSLVDSYKALVYSPYKETFARERVEVGCE